MRPHPAPEPTGLAGRLLGPLGCGHVRCRLAERSVHVGGMYVICTLQSLQFACFVSSYRGLCRLWSGNSLLMYCLLCCRLDTRHFESKLARQHFCLEARSSFAVRFFVDWGLHICIVCFLFFPFVICSFNITLLVYLIFMRIWIDSLWIKLY